MQEEQVIFNKQLEQLKKLSGLNISIDINQATIKDDIKKLSSLLQSISAIPPKKEIFKHLLLGTMAYDKLENYLSQSNFRKEDNFCLFSIFFHTSINELAREVLYNLFPSSKDCILEMDMQNICIIHKYQSSTSTVELAHNIADILNTEAMSSVIVCYSNTDNKLNTLSCAYNDNLLCINISKIFQPDKYVLANTKLGIGGLLYELSENVCKRFLKEVLKDDIALSLDEDTLHSIDTFISNNLNIAETARALHMHRNTLVYRIEQVEAKTGLDIRSFEGAMTFKLVSLITNFLNSKEGT